MRSNYANFRANLPRLTGPRGAANPAPMFELRPVGYVIGLTVAALGVTMLVPLGVDLWSGRGNVSAFFESAIITVLAGSIVALAEGKGLTLDTLDLADMREIEPRITDDVFSVLSPLASATSRTSYGGTAPARVREQVARWRELLQIGPQAK